MKLVESSSSLMGPAISPQHLRTQPPPPPQQQKQQQKISVPVQVQISEEIKAIVILKAQSHVVLEDFIRFVLVGE